MQTLKTAVVVVLLIAVCYGAFIALNAPEDDIPDNIKQWASSEDLEGLADVEFPDEFEIDTSNAISMPPDNWSLDNVSPPLPDAGSMQQSPGSSLPVGSSTPAPSDSAGLPQLPTLPSGDLSLPEANTADAMANASTIPLPNFPSTPSLPSEAAGTFAATLPPTSGAESPTEQSTVGTLISTELAINGDASSGGTELPLPDINSSGASAASMPANEFMAEGGNGAGSNSLAPSLLLPEATNSNTYDNARAGATATAANDLVPELPYAVAKKQGLAKAYAGELKGALEILSPYYDSMELGGDEHADLVNILDALSREAIYSKRHLLEPAYKVAAVDTLASVAQQYQITPELLVAINGMGASKALLANSELKVIRGPFRARVSLSRRELTLFLGNLYAGRFPITVGQDDPPVEGAYNVVERRRDRTYYGPGGTVIKANEPENPYGSYWLSLGNNLSIHGSPEMARSDLANAGCISLAPLDAADVYIILSQNTQVEIRR